MKPAGQTQWLLYLAFALSGFSGLIYESVWSHYLKLFLGHAAYAQALVLVIFMGGMALGAWLASRHGHRIRDPLLAYAIIEGITGLFGLGFHPLYQFIHALSFEQVIPALDQAGLVYLYKFLLASLLILPQSILLGATFPLMSSGFIRRFPQLPGKSISWLYFSNSIGAALALPFAAFFLIGKTGLPGTIMTAALINIAIAVLIYGLAGTRSRLDIVLAEPTGTSRFWSRLILSASLFTGMASFIYEVAWIRMLSMVIGSSTHSFELMLSAFITGLALGGYWIRNRIDTLKDPVLFVAIIQIIMGLLAYLTVFLYGHSYRLMAFFMEALAETESGYLIYSLVSHLIALLIMLPATICAGMTLPLFTSILLKRGHGERSIGQIYSANTIGAIIGVSFTIYIGMPVLGLHGSILAGSAIDIIVGLVILIAVMPALRWRFAAPAGAAVLTLFVLTALLHDFDPRQMASGVFRHGRAILNAGAEILFHQDGRTSTVTVARHPDNSVIIFTNGKPDAAVIVGDDTNTSRDESTMALLAAIPLSLHPQARSIANIGIGSGMTAHVALAMPEVERVDSIEIEPAMVAGARHFGAKTERIFTDPRSGIHIEDARTYFSTRQQQYDIIISEPSNPWVSGVSSLFTQEFYHSIKPFIRPGGLFVQWIQIYEFDHDLLVTILKALAEEFPYYSIYFADNGNLVLVAGIDRPVGEPSVTIFGNEAMQKQLQSIHVNNLQDFRFRFLGDQTLYNAYLAHLAVPANSDYYPLLDLQAPVARYLHRELTGLLDLRLSPVPILDILYDRTGYSYDTLTTNRYYPATQRAETAYLTLALMRGESPAGLAYPHVAGLRYLIDTAASCMPASDPVLWRDSLYLLIESTAVYLSPALTTDLLTVIAPVCLQAMLTADEQAWLAFLDTLGRRDVSALVETAYRLLDASTPLHTYQQQYVSTALLAGLVRQGRHEEATVLWRESMAPAYADRDALPFPLRFILSLITG